MQSYFRDCITGDFIAALEKELKMPLDITQQAAVLHIAENADALTVTDPRHVAYMLATAYHEARFLPIREIRAKRGTSIWAMQERYWPSGYYGRGLCQLTWKKNYEKFSPIVGQDLVAEPDRVLDVVVSAQILVHGMVHGLFSGKKLADYIPPPPALPDWLRARRTVNGDFQADRVADVAQRILAILVTSIERKIV